MANIGSLAVVITASADGVRQGVDQSIGHLKRLGKESGSGGGGLGSVGSLLMALPGAGLLTGGIAAAIKETLGAAAAAEQARIRFSALFGTAGEGAELQAELGKLARSAGFAGSELEPAARRLALAGLSAKETAGMIRELAAVSAATGQPVEALADILGHVAERGQLTSRELRSIRGPVLGALAETLGTTTTQLHQLAEQGAIGPKQLAAAFAHLTGEGGRFADALAVRANSMTGRWESLKAQVSSTATAVGKNFAALGGAGLDLGSFFAGIRSFLEWVRPAYAQVASLGRGVWSIFAEAWDELGRPVWEAVKTGFGWLREMLGLTGGLTFDLGETWITVWGAMLKPVAYAVDLFRLLGGTLIQYVAAPLSGPVLSAVKWVGTGFLTVYGFIASGANDYIVKPLADALAWVIKLARDGLHEVTSRMPASNPLWQKLHEAEDALLAAEGKVKDAGAFKFPAPDIGGFKAALDDIKAAAPDAVAAFGEAFKGNFGDAAKMVDGFVDRVRLRARDGGKGLADGLKVNPVNLDLPGGKLAEFKLATAATSDSKDAAHIIAQDRLQREGHKASKDQEQRAEQIREAKNAVGWLQRLNVQVQNLNVVRAARF